MKSLKRYLISLLGFIGNDAIRLKVKNFCKSIFLFLPFGFIAFMFISKRHKDRAKLILGLNYNYDLNGVDYIDPNLNLKLSRISLWGGV